MPLSSIPFRVFSFLIGVALCAPLSAFAEGGAVPQGLVVGAEVFCDKATQAVVFFPALITQKNGDTLTVTFADNSSEELSSSKCVPGTYHLNEQLVAGSRVLCSWSGNSANGIWPGQVVSRANDQLTIAFDDGDTKVVPATSCMSYSGALPSPPPQSSGGGTSGGGGGTGDEETDNEAGGSAIRNPLGNTPSLEALIATILHAVVQVGAVFLVLGLVWSGFMFAQAQGNEEKLKTARNALFWVVIGGIVLLGAEAIAQIVSATAKQL